LGLVTLNRRLRNECVKPYICTVKNLFAVLRYVHGYWRYAILNITFNIFSVIFSLFSIAMLFPFLQVLFTGPSTCDCGAKPVAGPAGGMYDKVNAYLDHIVQTKGKLQALTLICIFIISTIFLKNLFRYLAMYFLAPIRNGVVRDIRNTLYDKTLELHLGYYSEERKGDIISRMTADAQEVEWSIMSSLEMIFREPITILLYLGSMVFISPQLTLMAFLMLPATALLIGRIGKSLKRSSARGKERMGVIMSIMEETLSGLRIIKAFNAEAFVRKKFRTENDAYTKEMVGMYRKVDLSSPLSEFLGVAVFVVILYLGGRLVLGDQPMLNGSAFILYIGIFSQLINPSKSFTTAYYNIQKGLASSERIDQVLNTEVIIKEPVHAKQLGTFNRDIEYRSLSFAYTRGDKGYVLKNIELKIPKGKTIALVGQSGSGKSTLADLLPRFYDPSEGGIYIDGIDIRSYRLADLRSLMGIVSQEAILFNDTIHNNIAFGMPEATEAEVIAAAKIANAHDFITQAGQGYQTNIGDRGGKLSGGQRQRISIARAVLKNPPILILDEATSALDTESERLVQDALNKLMQNRTTLVIAHRLSTIQHADEIIVLHQGQIIERGTHSELLKVSGTYRKLYELQAFA
jgi:subfamily B ATP-binding cassette protein MsbA